jgi:hypothetical protein
MGFGMGFIAAALVRIKEQENGSDTGIGPNLGSLNPMRIYPASIGVTYLFITHRVPKNAITPRTTMGTSTS